MIGKPALSSHHFVDPQLLPLLDALPTVWLDIVSLAELRSNEARMLLPVEPKSVDPARIGVMGESAGGGLAAALALPAPDRGAPALRFQLLTYPMLNDRTCIAPEHPFAGDFVWAPLNSHFGWQTLLGAEPGSPHVSPYAAVARAHDLSGVPQTYIATGALDFFVNENLVFARRLLAAGVPVDLNLYRGAFHGFDLMPAADISRRALADRLAALRRFIEV